jgi:hypothetical protein
MEEENRSPIERLESRVKALEDQIALLSGGIAEQDAVELVARADVDHRRGPNFDDLELLLLVVRRRRRLRGTDGDPSSRVSHTR